MGQDHGWVAKMPEIIVTPERIYRNDRWRDETPRTWITVDQLYDTLDHGKPGEYILRSENAG